jgi:hypothetical protein
MREWLDSTRYEPAKFDCNQDGVDVVLSVEFMLDEAARAFAKRFDGEEDGPKSFVADSSPRFATWGRAPPLPRCRARSSRANCQSPPARLSSRRKAGTVRLQA